MVKARKLNFRDCLRLGIAGAFGAMLSHAIIGALGVPTDPLYSHNFDWRFGALELILLPVIIGASALALGYIPYFTSHGSSKPK